MTRGEWKTHTHWRWKPADPIRHIWLTQHRQTRIWQVSASSGTTEWRREYREFTIAMRECTAMVERTGGESQWVRHGPDFTGNVFDD